MRDRRTGTDTDWVSANPTAAARMRKGYGAPSHLISHPPMSLQKKEWDVDCGAYLHLFPI